MKRLLTLMFAAAVALALTMPAMAQDAGSQAPKTTKHHHKKHGKRHHKQAKKGTKQEQKG